MAAPSKAVRDFMEKYGVDSDEIWEVHGKTWVVKHKALERVAAEVGIVWDRPAMLECNSGDGVAALCVFGKLADRMEWSIGECLTVRADRAGGNYKVTGNQPGYVYAMAEKRAKDRVILKLLETSGALYSEAEADDFIQPEKRENPHVTRPDDIVPNTDGDQNNIPAPHSSIAPKPKAKSRDEFAKLQAELWACGSHVEMQTWGSHNANRIGEQPADWQKILRGIYKEHWDAIANLETGDAERMAS